MRKIGLTGVQQTDQNGISLLSIQRELPAIKSQKHIGGKQGHALVAVDEGVVNQQRLELGRGHLFQCRVVSGLRAVKRAFQ